MSDADLEIRIRARRNALAAQLADGQRQYAELEQAIALLRRNLDAMHGGLQELDALLAEGAEAPPPMEVIGGDGRRG